MMALSEALEPAFEHAIIQLEEETQMTYVTSVERVRLKREREQGIQIGREAGREEASVKILTAQLARKFGPTPDWAQVRLTEADEATLNRWALQVLDAQRIEDVFI